MRSALKFLLGAEVTEDCRGTGLPGTVIILTFAEAGKIQPSEM